MNEEKNIPGWKMALAFVAVLLVNYGLLSCHTADLRDEVRAMKKKDYENVIHLGSDTIIVDGDTLIREVKFRKP